MAGQTKALCAICSGHWARSGQNVRMFEVPELSKMRRRPRPLKQLDPRARLARLRLEAELFRPHLVRQNIRFEPSQLQAVDEERRLPAYGIVPSRAALIRQLIIEGLAWRKAMRPRTSGPAKGEPFLGL
jgi:hypothetical protein